MKPTRDHDGDTADKMSSVSNAPDKMSAASMFVPIAQIGELAPDDYVGMIDDAAVTHMVARLDAEGLLTPIWVRKNGNAAAKRYSVIAGRHRLRAAIALRWTDILVEVRAGQDSTSAELRRLQLVENLDRRTPRPIERACLIMERWQSEARSRAWDIVSHARELDDLTGLQCGNVDGRTVRRYRRLFDAIVVPFPQHFAKVNAHPFGANLADMSRIAALKHSDRHLARRKAIEALLDHEKDWQSIDDLLENVLNHGSKGTRVDRRNHRALIGTTWEKMPLTERRKFLFDDLPKKLTRDMAERLAAKLVTEFDL